MEKYTVVIGASENTERYSNKAIRMLLKYNHPIFAIGNKVGKVENVEIETEKKIVKNVDTVTLYLNEKHQVEYYDYILSLHPKRIIFNPGTENEVLEKLAKENSIEAMEACTLVLLSTGQY